MIGERIKELREKNNLTQSALSKKLGLSRAAVNAWEMGTSIPSTQYLVELSNVFKVPTDYILELNNEERISITNLEEEEKKIIFMLIDYFNKHKIITQFIDKRKAFQIEKCFQEIIDSNIDLPEHIQKLIDEVMES